jgi:hypothetical protein
MRHSAVLRRRSVRMHASIRTRPSFDRHDARAHEARASSECPTPQNTNTRGDGCLLACSFAEPPSPPTYPVARFATRAACAARRSAEGPKRSRALSRLTSSCEPCAWPCRPSSFRGALRPWGPSSRRAYEQTWNETSLRPFLPPESVGMKGTIKPIPRYVARHILPPIVVCQRKIFCWLSR